MRCPPDSKNATNCSGASGKSKLAPDTEAGVVPCFAPEHLKITEKTLRKNLREIFVFI